MTILNKLQALSSEKRLQIMHWLTDPIAYFPAQTDGDLIKDGVCVASIAEKLGTSQPTASEHLKVLSAAGLISGKKIKKWTFYKRNEDAIKAFKKEVKDNV